MRSANLGASSSPHTFTVSREYSAPSITVVAKRSASISRYAASSSTFSPFQKTRKAPAEPIHSETARGLVPARARTYVVAYPQISSRGRMSSPKSNQP